MAYNGNPTFRIWPVGTRRILGIEETAKLEEPVVPKNVMAYLERLFTEGEALFGDYVVCPLTVQRPGEMQWICVESAKNLVVR